MLYVHEQYVSGSGLPVIMTWHSSYSYSYRDNVSCVVLTVMWMYALRPNF